MKNKWGQEIKTYKVELTKRDLETISISLGLRVLEFQTKVKEQNNNFDKEFYINCLADIQQAKDKINKVINSLYPHQD